MSGSLVFVHGTGVRLAGYEQSVDLVRREIDAAGLTCDLMTCAWGDPLGITFEGRSLPEPPQIREEDARWAWLLDDPFLELERLSIRYDPSAPPSPPGRRPQWSEDLAKIRAYRPSDELSGLLGRMDLEDDWLSAWASVIGSPLVALAFERSGEAGELADCGRALARALIAQLHVLATTAGRQGPSGTLRERLYERLATDWGYGVYGLGTFVSGLAKRAATASLRKHRAHLNQIITGPIGDILLYQARGAEIRAFIRHKVEQAPAPVILVGHSLGGVACVDLMAMAGAPAVSALVTLGSQAPYFHEIGALSSLNEGDQLPAGFPPWLNVYDRNDFLSFIGEQIFPGRVRDFEARSGQPFPESHGAYFGNPAVWAEVRAWSGRG